MSAQQRSYHLHRAREIGPRRQFDLHALIAKELGLGTAPKRRNWMVIALRICAFVGGVTIVAHVPSGTGSGNAVAIQSKVHEAQELSDRIRDYKHIQIAEVAMSGFSKTKGPGGRLDQRFSYQPGFSSPAISEHSKDRREPGHCIFTGSAYSNDP